MLTVLIAVYVAESTIGYIGGAPTQVAVFESAAYCQAAAASLNQVERVVRQSAQQNGAKYSRLYYVCAQGAVAPLQKIETKERNPK